MLTSLVRLGRWALEHLVSKWPYWLQACVLLALVISLSASWNDGSFTLRIEPCYTRQGDDNNQ